LFAERTVEDSEPSGLQNKASDFQRPTDSRDVSAATLYRRRRVVACLVLTAIVAGVLSLAVPVLLSVACVVIATLLAYLAALVYVRRAELDRARRVVVLETRREAAIALCDARRRRGIAGDEDRPMMGGSCWSVIDHPEEPSLASAAN
jgi:hypothetical protein